MYKYFKKIGSTKNILSWESKELSNEIIKPPSTCDNSLAPTLKCTYKRIYVKLNRSCLKQDNITFNHGKKVNIYIVYDLNSTLN